MCPHFRTTKVPRESYLHLLSFLQQRLQTRQESRMKHIIIRIKFKESAIKLVIELNSLHRVTKDPKRKISNHNCDPNVKSHTSPVRFQHYKPSTYIDMIPSNSLFQKPVFSKRLVYKKTLNNTSINTNPTKFSKQNNSHEIFMKTCTRCAHEIYINGGLISGTTIQKSVLIECNCLFWTRIVLYSLNMQI